MVCVSHWPRVVPLVRIKFVADGFSPLVFFISIGRIFKRSWDIFCNHCDFYHERRIAIQSRSLGWRFVNVSITWVNIVIVHDDTVFDMVVNIISFDQYGWVFNLCNIVSPTDFVGKKVPVLLKCAFLLAKLTLNFSWLLRELFLLIGARLMTANSEVHTGIFGPISLMCLSISTSSSSCSSSIFTSPVPLLCHPHFQSSSASHSYGYTDVLVTVEFDTFSS